MFTDRKDALRDVLKSSSLRLPHLMHASSEVRRDTAIGLPLVDVTLRVRADGDVSDKVISLAADTLDRLISQLQEVKELMKEIH